MKTNEFLKLIDEAFLEKVYGFAYRRCNTSYEAEDLCSQIILNCIVSLQKQREIENFYGFVWTIARRVYADYCEKRNVDRQTISLENAEYFIGATHNEIDDFIEDIANTEQLKRILYEITFLSKAYREVMVMYYIDEIKIKDIATRLNINETTVKQRLFSARNEIRKEVSVMKEKNLTLRPISLAISGTGNPMGNDPRSKTERMFSQNLLYLCKDKPKTAKELSEELCVPMPYIEEELEIQVHGENGNYGMLRKLPNGKYTINVLVVDYEEYDKANKIYEKYLPKISSALKKSLEKYKDEILSFPFLSCQDDIRFILWSLISRTFWNFESDITELIKKKHFNNIEPVNRPFSTVAVAFREDDTPRFDFYGSDGIDATSVCGYRHIFTSNIYGKRIEKHFHCGHNLSHDQKLIMLIRSIGGMHIDTLTDDEKEIVAKAIECGYIRKNGDVFEPNIIVMNKTDEKAFYTLSNRLHDNMGEIKEAIADELATFMKAHIPEHLMNEYEIYIQLIAGIRILSATIEECIKEELLTEPKQKLGAEGMIMVVEK
ncbi:MAG: RNA polymerase sigma factor [Faecalimonas sp.]|nr:RNA polymerase sigma factor [Faecalimonas sp.]